MESNFEGYYVTARNVETGETHTFVGLARNAEHAILQAKANLHGFIVLSAKRVRK